MTLSCHLNEARIFVHFVQLENRRRTRLSQRDDTSLQHNRVLEITRRTNRNSHRPQTPPPPQCCHLRGYFKHTPFSSRSIRMMSWIFNTPTTAYSRPWLQEVVLNIRCLQRVFIRTKHTAACECEPRCLSLAATSSSRCFQKTGNA